ncbi:MAG: helicase [Marinilabiliales bacterium]|nr:MAG: helicase [Marinilabiliales bacterium]
MNNNGSTELKLAYDFVLQSHRHVFLTGKAGTGKTTFLHNLRKNCPKRIAVAAPTGVAAINAGGVTLHSLFQLPFGPLVPSTDGTINETLRSIHFRKNKIKLLQSIDLLVIDEISMVRPDILDAIDGILRRFRDRNKLFGGVQLLMIGDLHQLPPVIRENEWSILKPYYRSVYFFSSLAYQKANPVQIELKKVFRQSDKNFIDLLESVRHSGLTDHSRELLNSRFSPDLLPEDLEGTIILCTHNAQADNINAEKLNHLGGTSEKFTAKIDGVFPEYSYPTHLELELKTGAQVMFVKNDESYEKRFFNGKIGTIQSMEKDRIFVECEDDEDLIEVERLEWKNIKYSLNEGSKEIEEEQLGSFIQFPLKLAWAITIHKSQGLSFDKVVVDAHAAFAHGQVYVALSRCRTFEGLILSSEISDRSVKVDHVIQKFTSDFDDNQISEDELFRSKHEFQADQILELFDFDDLDKILFKFHSTVNNAASSVNPDLAGQISKLRQDADENIFKHAGSFRRQIMQLAGKRILPEENQELKERLKAAAIYFDEKIFKIIFEFTLHADIDSDNKSIKTALKEFLSDIQKAGVIKMKCLDHLKTDFISLQLSRIKSNAEIDFKFEQEKAARKKKVREDDATENPGLYDRLREWRNEMAHELGKGRHLIMPNKTLLTISNALPHTEEDLLAIKGVGKKKLTLYGGHIFKVIADYIKEKELEEDKETSKLKEKTPSHEKSYQLFEDGYSVPEIAKQRSMTVSTIYKHLELYLGSGQIDISRLVAKDKIAVIKEAARGSNFESLSELKAVLGTEYSYDEIKLVLRSMESI